MVMLFSSVKSALSKAWKRVKKAMSRWLPKCFRSKSPDLSPEQQLTLITRNLDENSFPDRNKLLQILREKGEIRILWRTRVQDQPRLEHLGKIADFLNAGCEVTVLFTDLHDKVNDLPGLECCIQLYRPMLTAMLEGVGVPLDKLIFLQSLDHRHIPEYERDFYRLTKSLGYMNISKLDALYLALDEKHLEMDAQFGGAEQKEVFSDAEAIPFVVLRCDKRVHLTMPAVAGLEVEVEEDRIFPLDSKTELRTKLEAASCTAGDVEQNGVLPLVEHFIFPLCGEFTLKLRGGEDEVRYDNYAELMVDFSERRIHPDDLTTSVQDLLTKILRPGRNKFIQAAKAMHEEPITAVEWLVFFAACFGIVMTVIISQKRL